MQSCVTVGNQATDEALINSMLDSWHHAAAVADEEGFYGKFTADGIYIGTDPTEHWKAIELQTWAKSAFERESAWDFKPYDRHIFYAEDGKTAWFDELLDTWMGTCRGSGVLQKVKGEWKITHYHLAVAVPNESIDAYLEIIEKKSNNKN